MRHMSCGKFISLLLALIAAAPFVELAARADTVSMTFAGVGRGRGGVDLYYRGSRIVNNAFTGQLFWNVTASTHSGIGTGLTMSFCGDIFDYALSGNFQTTDVQNAPDAAELGGNGMGATKASLVSHLYSNYYQNVDKNDFSTTHDDASGFQVALWEIINERLATAVAEGGFDVGGDRFRATDMTAGARAAAQAMLADVFAAWQSGDLENTRTLIGLTGNAQDQILLIPLPRTLWLAIPGLLLAGLFRRRGWWTP